MLRQTRLSRSSLFCSAMIVASVSVSRPYAAWAQPVAPEVASFAAGVVPAPTGTLRQQEWLKASIDQRITLSEQLGEYGARAFAKSKGYEVIMDGTGKTLSQGPDQVYRALDGTVHVLEAKGGSGQLGHAYGYPQGSSEWAVESAKRVLASPMASATEKDAAEAILQAAKEGRLYVDVIRTSHVLGEPVAAVLEQSVHSTEGASSIASAALDELTVAPIEVIDGAAQATASSCSTVLETAGTVAIPEAIAIDGALRVRQAVLTERQFASGKITVEQREVAHAQNIAGMAGGWGGAWAGTELGAMGGGAAGTAVVPGPGTAVGAVVGGAAGGVAGYIGGRAAAEAAAAWAVTRVHAVATTVSKAASSAWGWTRRHWIVASEYVVTQ